MKCHLIRMLILTGILISCAHHPASLQGRGSQQQPGTAEEIAIREPVVDEFILGPSDEISVFVWRQKDLERTVRVSPYGTVTLPLVGEIQAAGLSTQALTADIAARLSEYYVNPIVTVSVVSIGSQKVFVLGEVRRPGVYPLERSKTLIESLVEAGGLTHDAEQKTVMLIRGAPSEPQPRLLNVEAVLQRGDMAENPGLQKGDIIFVPATRIADLHRFFKHLWGILPVNLGLVVRKNL